MHIIADLIIILLITHTIISGYHALRPLYVNCFFHRYTSIAFSTHEKKNAHVLLNGDNRKDSITDYNIAKKQDAAQIDRATPNEAPVSFPLVTGEPPRDQLFQLS